mmetsp:Transcript_13254/g.22497  ORF Transcript_13254/g.22497 Transcript_13254/m.22497 type:complete len:91 (-) Transcript_13254:1521-1793(-)
MDQLLQTTTPPISLGPASQKWASSFLQGKNESFGLSDLKEWEGTMDLESLRNEERGGAPVVQYATTLVPPTHSPWKQIHANKATTRKIEK